MSGEHCNSSYVQILLTEDNPNDVFLVEEALRTHSVRYQLHVARDGDAALGYLEELHTANPPLCPNVVLLDLNTPKGDSLEVLRYIKKYCPKAAIVILSASLNPADRTQTAKLGADQYFLKPGNLDDFLKLGAIVKQLAGA